MVTTDGLDRMEHVGETVISVHDALVVSTDAEVQPQSGDDSESLLHGYPTDTSPAQPAPPLPVLHVAFSAMTNQNIQNLPEVVGYSEGLHQAYPTTLTPAQPVLPALPHHHDPPEPTLSPQNIQVQPEDVEYWKGLPQVYPCNVSNSQPAPARDLSAFPTWPEQNMNPKAQTEGYSEGLPQAYKSNSTHPASPFPASLNPPHQCQAFPSWSEQNVQVQQSDEYWDGALRPPVPYTLTIPSTYNGLQCQDSAMLQNHVLSVGYAYEGQVRKKPGLLTSLLVIRSGSSKAVRIW